MNRTERERLARLEQRQRKNRFAHLSEEELWQRADELLVWLVEAVGIDEARAQISQRIGRDMLPDVMGRLDALQAQGRIRTA